jgi:predicted DNA-binding transcriptional regulator YafY
MSLRLERLLAMDAAIRSRSFPSVSAFMHRFEVSERTVRGDMTNIASYEHCLEPFELLR